MKAKITSLGKFLPDKVIKNSEFEKFLDTSDEWIISRTGIKERRKLDIGKASSYMAIKAIKIIRNIVLNSEAFKPYQPEELRPGLNLSDNEIVGEVGKFANEWPPSIMQFVNDNPVMATPPICG